MGLAIQTRRWPLNHASCSEQLTSNGLFTDLMSPIAAGSGVGGVAAARAAAARDGRHMRARRQCHPVQRGPAGSWREGE